MFILDHNFWTRNRSKSSKVSKDSDSNKNLSEILPSSGLGLGPDEVGQKGLKRLHLWCHSQKTWNPKPKKFVSLQMETLAKSFEGLNSSLLQSSAELFLYKHTCKLDFSLSLPQQVLTLWEPGYDIFVLWNQLKTSSCQLPYQHPSSSADCARELFKGSNKLASLLVCTRK